jgi:NADH:ubiquinone oxidoreductase subunit C
MTYLNPKLCAQAIERTLPAWAIVTSVSQNSFMIQIPHNELVPVLTVLKNHTLTQCKTLTDVTATDWLGRPEDNILINNMKPWKNDLRISRVFNNTDETRFCLVYNLLSTRYRGRIMLKTFLPKNNPVIESATPLFNSANWWEREVWDMYGITFTNHPDLRRLLTDYGFQGYPLRKDFPLTGYTETRYDENSKRVVLESLDLAQEFRYFDISTPWVSSSNE